MKKFGIFIAILVVLIGVALAFGSTIEREVRTEIEIEAPADRVWAVATDFNQWADWSPIINAASGVAQAGALLSITMIGEDNGDGPTYEPIVLNADAPRFMRFQAKIVTGSVFTNEKVFLLEPTDAGTKLVHIEVFKDALVPLMWGQVQANVPSMLDSMNAALKEKVEAGG